jgi:type VI secretion system secreted protein Hcp
VAIDAYLMFNESSASASSSVIKGEATRKGFEGAIEIESFNFDIANTVNLGSATSGAGAGKVQFNPFVVKKRPDISSPTILQSCAAGMHYQKASVIVAKAGGNNSVTYLCFDFSLVFVKSVEWSVDSGADTPLEVISFEYGGLAVTYKPQKTDGTAGSAVVGGWNRITNSKFTG